ncbi:hypothetical protein BJ170DRAFT_595051 [Xylariales sp. AK1849]|nr:hypothetical protein BJ170DRAFT_595051 [Xylariales sp. AK1849]
MAQYRVAIRIHPDWVDHFRNTKMSLCSSFGVKTNYSAVEYNVIATSEDPTPLNTITWVETYSMGACKTNPSLNSYVFSSTVPSSVEPGELFSVSSSWTTSTPGASALAPKGGFLFVNEPSASALLFKRVRNAAVPVYVTTVGGRAPPTGKHTMKPTGNVLLFFMAQEAGTAFDRDAINTDAFELPYIAKGGGGLTLFYNQDGLWETEVISKAGEPKL